MTLGERALLRLAEFFATAGVALFAATLPPVATFIAGLGWCWVLISIDEWAWSVEALERIRRRLHELTGR